MIPNQLTVSCRLLRCVYTPELGFAYRHLSAPPTCWALSHTRGCSRLSLDSRRRVLLPRLVSLASARPLNDSRPFVPLPTPHGEALILRVSTLSQLGAPRFLPHLLHGRPALQWMDGTVPTEPMVRLYPDHGSKGDHWRAVLSFRRSTLL